MSELSLSFQTWPHPELHPLSLQPDEWHVWSIEHLDCIPGYTLSPSEEQHAARFVFDRDRRCFALTRTVLRHLLTAYTGQPANAHQLIAGPRLKPQLAHGDIHFNVSHSGNRSLLAFARRPLGVDIEWIQPVPEIEQIVVQNFAPGEQKRWANVAMDLRELAFFLCWTRKEAYVKALGDGLYLPLDSFEVALDPGESARFLTVPGWSLYDLSAPGYAAALTIEGTAHSHSEWHLDLTSTQLSFGPGSAR